MGQETTSQPAIDVVNYDPKWQDLFGQLRGRIWPSVCDFAVGIDHVGSTAVPGLAAKPVIDIDIVVASRQEVPLAITRLTNLEYTHLGDLGIPDREAFGNPPWGLAHNLYVCTSESLALRNHIAFRDYLRAHPTEVMEYSALKKKLACEFSYDIATYVEGKSNFILSVLSKQGFSAHSTDSIRRVNRKAEASNGKATDL